MIEIKDIANIIETGLNGLTQAVDFKVWPSEGEFINSVKTGRYNPQQSVNAILRPIQTNVTPILDLKNYSFQLVLEMVVATVYVEEVSRVLGQYVENSVGYVGQLLNFNYVYDMTMPEIGQKAQRADVGDSVVITATCYFQFISNGKISNECVVTIDGESIMYLSAAFARSKGLETDNYDNNTELKSVATQQALAFKATIPYRETTVIVSLVNEILNGTALTQTHAITYADGDVATSRTMILNDGALNLEAGKIGTIELVFTLAR